MIKRELKVNLKSFILWTSILIGIFLVVFLVYPFIVTDDSMKNLDEMMKVFPPELLKAFNMDITSINTAYGWLKSEGFMFIDYNRFLFIKPRIQYFNKRGIRQNNRILKFFTNKKIKNSNKQNNSMHNLYIFNNTYTRDIQLYSIINKWQL